MNPVVYVLDPPPGASPLTPQADGGAPGARAAGTDPPAFRARVGGHELRWSPVADDTPARHDETRTAALRLVTQVGRAFEDSHPGVRPILAHGRHLVVDGSVDLGGTEHWQVTPLPTGVEIAEPSTAQPARLDEPTRALADAVSAQSFRADVAWLSALDTRHSLSVGFTQAVDRAQDRLDGLGFTTRRESITVGTGHSENLVADRPGLGDPAERGLVVVSAHLDSINQAGGPSAPAPGADDNGSGSAGLLELARVLATGTWQHDLRLVLFGGEEEGLFGSRQHIAAMSRDDRHRTRAVLNMDMIGTRNGPTATVLLEGAALSSTQIADLAAAAAAVTGLAVETSLSPFASDHVPFIDRRMPAVLTIEGGDSSNTHIHSAADVIDHVDAAFAREILRMNVVALAGWLVPAVVAPPPTDPPPADPLPASPDPVPVPDLAGPGDPVPVDDC